MSAAPDRDSGFQEIAACIGEVETARAPVVLVRNNCNEAAAFERLEIGGQRGAVHRQEFGRLAKARRVWPVERHQKRILTMADAEWGERLVKPAGEGPGCAVNAKAQAAPIDFVRDAERQI